MQKYTTDGISYSGKNGNPPVLSLPKRFQKFTAPELPVHTRLVKNRLRSESFRCDCLRVPTYEYLPTVRGCVIKTSTVRVSLVRSPGAEHAINKTYSAGWCARRTTYYACAFCKHDAAGPGDNGALIRRDLLRRRSTRTTFTMRPYVPSVERALSIIIITRHSRSRGGSVDRSGEGRPRHAAAATSLADSGFRSRRQKTDI